MSPLTGRSYIYFGLILIAIAFCSNGYLVYRESQLARSVTSGKVVNLWCRTPASVGADGLPVVSDKAAQFWLAIEGVCEDGKTRRRKLSVAREEWLAARSTGVHAVRK